MAHASAMMLVLQVPFAAVRYTTGECNYGGRVTDDKDRQLLITLLEKCCCQELVSIPRHKLSPSGTYYAPEAGTHQDYLKYAFLTMTHLTIEHISHLFLHNQLDHCHANSGLRAHHKLA